RSAPHRYLHSFPTRRSSDLCHNFVSTVEVCYRPAVAHDMSLESPLISQYVHQQRVAGTAWLVVRTVIGAHHGFDPRIYQRLKGGKVGLVKILLRNYCVKLMAKPFWSAVNSIMLCASRGFQIDGIVTLQSPDVSGPQA